MRTIKPYLTEELLKHCKNDRSKVAATENDLAIHIGELKSILQELNIPAAD